MAAGVPEARRWRLAAIPAAAGSSWLMAEHERAPVPREERPVTDVAAWLRGLGLGQYEAAFRDNGVDAVGAPGADGRGPEGDGRRRGRAPPQAARRHRRAARRRRRPPRPSRAEPPPAGAARRCRSATPSPARSGGSSRCCSATSRARPRSRPASTRRTCARSWPPTTARSAEAVRQPGRLRRQAPRRRRARLLRLARGARGRRRARGARRPRRGGGRRGPARPRPGRWRRASGSPPGRWWWATCWARARRASGAWWARRRTSRRGCRRWPSPGRWCSDAATRRLTGALFEWADLGEAELKGLPAPGARVARAAARAPSRAASRRCAPADRAAPLVGREEELELLLRRWRRARSGEGQVVLLARRGRHRQVAPGRRAAGGAGRRREEHERLDWLLLAPAPGQRAASRHRPARARRRLRCRGTRRRRRLAKLRALLAPGDPTPEEVGLIADLLGLPARRPAIPAAGLSPQQRRERTLAALLRRLEALAARRPVLGGGRGRALGRSDHHRAARPHGGARRRRCRCCWS